MLAEAERLGYRPNVLAQSLMTGRTNLIGLVSNNFDNPAFMEIFDLFTRLMNERAHDKLLLADISGYTGFMAGVEQVRNIGVGLAALLVIGNGLNHGSENVRINLLPVEAADMEQVGPCDLAEARALSVAGKKLPIHVRKLASKALDASALTIGSLDIHCPKNLGHDEMCVG